MAREALGKVAFGIGAGLVLWAMFGEFTMLFLLGLKYLVSGGP